MSLLWMVLNWRESNLHEPSLSIEEEVPENLGHNWRVLYPFELPGVRFPTKLLLHLIKGGWQKMML